MKQTLEKLRSLLERSGQADRIENPAAPGETAAWESQRGAVLPDEIREFLLFSNGFTCGMELIVLRSLHGIFPSEYSRVIPDGWYKLGSLYYGSADLVSDESGHLFVFDRCNSTLELKAFSLQAWIKDTLFPYLEDDGIGKTLGYVRMLLGRSGMTEKLQAPVSAQDITDWEAVHRAVIPEEIKAFLRFSDGFQYNWGALDIHALQHVHTVHDWNIVPDGWYSLGSVIGDGAYLVSDPNGSLFLADHENHDAPLRRISLKGWIEDHILEMLEEDADADRAEVLTAAGIWKPLP